MENDHKTEDSPDNATNAIETYGIENNEKITATDAISEPTMEEDTGSATNNGTAKDIDTAIDNQQARNITETTVNLIQKLNALQEKAKTLRDKLGHEFGPKGIIRQHGELVLESEVARRQNDANAALSMSKIGAMTPVVSQLERRRPIIENGASAKKRLDTDSSSSCSMELPQNMKTMQFGQQKPLQQQAAKQKKMTRHELEEQLQGMRELLQQLALQNPQLETKVLQLTQNNAKFKNLDLFVPMDALGMQATCSRNATTNQQQRVSQKRHDSEQSSTSSLCRQQGGASGRKRLESMGSDASSVNINCDATGTATSNKDPAESDKRKKNRRGKGNRTKRSAAYAKKQETEQEALGKYLKSIVQEYLGERQADKIDEYAYNPDVENLEEYAQRLVQAGLGQIVEDEIRVNRKNNRQSFITMSTDREGTQRDGIILVPVARRYAFEGDIVRAFVMNSGVGTTNNANDASQKSKKEETIATTPSVTGGKDNSFCLADDEVDPFTDDGEFADSDADPNELDLTLMSQSDGCPKAFVIAIVKQTEKREVVGTISFKNATKLNDEKSYYKLKPHDMRVPMVFVPAEACDAKISQEEKNDICGFLYVVKVRKTDANGHCIGELDQPVGKVGNLEAEIKAILLHNGLKNVRPYEERFNEMFAQADPQLTEQDLSNRKDLRKMCIFTIDPLTARDLDDAVSCEQIGNDLYEVGVHISDVAHYLAEDTDLDNIVKDRATSIYLVNEVIHMLPKPLCFKCSLLPGEDKFAFSVFWQIKLNGQIIGQPRFTRSIINSCTQFAYEHAQMIIDNPHEEYDSDSFPTITNGFTPSHITWRVFALNKIATRMRAKRYDLGALSINNPKLRFTMNPQTGEPISYEVDGRREANFLIEEFMLLANQSVARFIYDSFPDIAILRNHAPPLSKSLKSLKEKLANLGIDFDFSSSKTIYDSMQRICATAKDPEAMDACLSTLLTKPMARARYFCSEGKTEESDLWHYALSIPIYTHFTSPIRRYPDILVHRLLAAALKYCPPPKRTTEELHQIAKVCNEQKFNAKNAGDESTNLFFKRYIKSKQSIILRAVVFEIFNHLLNVVTIETGHSISINYKMQKVLVDTSNVPAFVLIAEKNSSKPPQKLSLFATVDVRLVIWDDKVCGFFASPDPKQRQANSIEASKKKSQNATETNGSIPEASSNGNGTRKQRHSSINDETANEPQFRQKNRKKAAKQKAHDENFYAV